MGWIKHHAIIVTGWNDEAIVAAHGKAEMLGLSPSPISGPAVNGYTSFFCPPDGSKEGWDRSDEGEASRDLFLKWMTTNKVHKAWNFQWLEVAYGEVERPYASRWPDTPNNEDELDIVIIEGPTFDGL